MRSEIDNFFIFYVFSACAENCPCRQELKKHVCYFFKERIN